MSRSIICRVSCARLLVVGAVIFGGRSTADAAEASIYDYHQVASFNLPAAGSLYSSLATGNLAVLNQTQVLIQNGIDSSSFTAVGNLPSAFNPSFAPTFLTTAPNGAIVAAGDGSGDIAVFSPASPSTAAVYNIKTANDFDAKWATNNLLAITDPNGVDLLDTSSGKVTNLISDISGYSGGIAFDAAGNLYTGDGDFVGPGTDQPGLASGASQTGLIKVFSKSSWQNALASGTPLDFEKTGIAVAQLLSASSLGFDNSGNFFAGGADSFGSTGNYGYESLVSASAIQTAAASQQTTLITGSSSREIADPYGQYDPGYFSYNDATGDLYLQYPYDEGTAVRIYAVPEPGSIALLCFGASAILLRRRNRAKLIMAMTAGTITLLGMAGPARASYVYDASDFATAVVSSTVTGSNPAYSDPSAILGQPPLTFNNSSNPNVIQSRLTKIVEAPINYDLNGNPVVTSLPNYPTTTQITLQMGKAITHDASHPYGDDLIVFGNSFYLAPGSVSDSTNLNGLILSGSIYAHPAQVSVSPDNAHWFSFPITSGLQPYNAYKWDDLNADWTSEELNPTVPLDPSLYATNFAGESAAQVLDAYGDSAGGTAFNLMDAVDSSGNTLFQDGYSSIDFVQVSSTSSGYSVISGISAVSPAQPSPTYQWVPEPADLTAFVAGGLSLLRRLRA